MFEKIKRGFITFFSCIWVTAMAFMMANSNDMDGAEVNARIAALCWAVFIFIIIKRHPVVSCVISFVAVLIARFAKFGLVSYPHSPKQVLRSSMGQ